MEVVLLFDGSILLRMGAANETWRVGWELIIKQTKPINFQQRGFYKCMLMGSGFYASKILARKIEKAVELSNVVLGNIVKD